MEQSFLCPSCQASISSADYFCPTCGKNLKAKPLSTSLSKKIIIYAASFFLAPFGLWWARKYIKQGDDASKKIGIIIIVITVVAIVLELWATTAFYSAYSRLITSFTSGSYTDFGF